MEIKTRRITPTADDVDVLVSTLQRRVVAFVVSGEVVNFEHH
jgi:hypothetical protein